MRHMDRTHLLYRLNDYPMKNIFSLSTALRVAAISFGLVLLMYLNFAEAAEIKGDPILMKVELPSSTVLIR
mgnify:CR=1 FL=1|jgi:hypothetical protein